jgi:hypothetical protein
MQVIASADIAGDRRNGKQANKPPRSSKQLHVEEVRKDRNHALLDGAGRFTLAAGVPRRSLYTNLLLKGLQDSMMARVRTGCDRMAPTDGLCNH